MGPGVLHPFITEEDTAAQRAEVTCSRGPELNSHSSLHFTAAFPDLGWEEEAGEICGVFSCGGGPAVGDLAIRAGMERVRVGRGLRCHQSYL